MKIGRFVVETHAHAQRFAAGPELKAKGKPPGESARYGDLSNTIRALETYDNSARLRYDMECYGVDMCVLLPAFGMSNELNLQIVEQHPDKFVAMATATRTRGAVARGEIEWSIEAVVQELDEWLATGRFVGIGEGMPPNPGARGTMSQPERLDQIRAVMQIARKHRVVATIHTGIPCGYPMTHATWPESINPIWLLDIAAEFPDVPIILNHGGVQGWWSTQFFEQCLAVAASNDNVYLECGLYWPELYMQALLDPNIGAEKLVWGTDWGASMPFHANYGNHPPVYAVQLRKQGLPQHQVDYWGWSLKQLLKLDITQDDLNLIVGGNAVRLFKLKVPHTRLFRPVGKEIVPQPERPAKPGEPNPNAS